MNQILECVPNFSEGRDLSVIEKLCDCFRGKPGVRLLDYTWDQDHNRCVLTIIGEPEPLRDAVVESIGRAVELIDMTKHQGQHPRMGCVDVVPLYPHPQHHGGGCRPDCQGDRSAGLPALWPALLPL